MKIFAVNTSLFFQLQLQGKIVCGGKMKIFAAGQGYLPLVRGTFRNKTNQSQEKNRGGNQETSDPPQTVHSQPPGEPQTHPKHCTSDPTPTGNTL